MIYLWTDIIGQLKKLMMSPLKKINIFTPEYILIPKLSLRELIFISIKATTSTKIRTQFLSFVSVSKDVPIYEL